MSTSEGETTGVIGDQTAVDDLRELPLEAAQRLTGRLALNDLACVVVAPGTRVHDLDPRHQVERVVQRAVAASRQAVPDDSPLETSMGAVPE